MKAFPTLTEQEHGGLAARGIDIEQSFHDFLTYCFFNEDAEKTNKVISEAAQEPQLVKELDDYPPLSPAERDVLKDIANGYSVAQSSNRHGRGIRTSRSYLKRAKVKLNANTIHHMVANAIRTGQILPHEILKLSERGTDRDLSAEQLERRIERQAISSR